VCWTAAFVPATRWFTGDSPRAYLDPFAHLVRPRRPAPGAVELTPLRVDPFAGLRPARPSDGGGGGLGLWITYRSCDRVSLDRRSDRFAIRLTAGDPR